MLFSSAVGSWIDRSPSRMSTQLTTISLNHAAVVASYVAWLFWPVIAGWGNGGAGENQGPFSSFQKGILYGVILLLDVVHDLSNIANKLSLERDWVPVLVGPITPEITYGLTQVNSVLVRIEMICQLCAPLLLPFIMSLNSRTGWILLLAGTTVVLWIIEVWIARLIARENAELQTLKKFSNDAATVEDLVIENQYEHLKPGIQSLPRKLYFVLYKDPAVRLRHYFSVGMWPASIANGMLNLTVLAYSATLITYLLEIGFSLESITVARASGAIMGLSGTVITPALVAFLRKRELRRSLTSDENEVEEDGGEGKIVRKVGFWGISSQFLCMVSLLVLIWEGSDY
jgi:iron-regulated transporter 1